MSLHKINFITNGMTDSLDPGQSYVDLERGRAGGPDPP